MFSRVIHITGFYMVAPFLFIPKQYSVVWLYHDFIQSTVTAFRFPLFSHYR